MEIGQGTAELCRAPVARSLGLRICCAAFQEILQGQSCRRKSQAACSSQLPSSGAWTIGIMRTNDVLCLRSYSCTRDCSRSASEPAASDAPPAPPLRWTASLHPQQSPDDSPLAIVVKSSFRDQTIIPGVEHAESSQGLQQLHSLCSMFEGRQGIAAFTTMTYQW